jgi:hypothetical protein
MTKHQKLTPIFLLGVAILVIILLATGLTALEFRSGDLARILALLTQEKESLGADFAPAVDESFPIELLLLIFFWSLLAFAIIFAIVSPHYRKVLVRVFILTLCLAFVLSTLADRLRIEEQEQILPEEVEGGLVGETGELAASELPEPPDFIARPPNWLMLFLYVVLVLVLLLVGLFLWRSWRSRFPGEQALLVQHAEQALSDLTSGGDLRDVVMRCYARMSQVLYQSRNIKRDEAMTPREFESHLAEIGLRDDHIRQLTRLFEGVRYGTQTPDEYARYQAVNCLRAIVQNYGKAS